MPVDFEQIDRSIAIFMRRYGVVALRISLAIIFVWFGILKPVGLSPAEPLLLALQAPERGGAPAVVRADVVASSGRITATPGWDGASRRARP